MNQPRTVKLPCGMELKPNRASNRMTPSSTIPTTIKVGPVAVGVDGMIIDGPDATPLFVDLNQLVRVMKIGKGNSGQVWKYKEADGDMKYAVKEICLPSDSQNYDTVASELRMVLGQRISNTVTLHNAYVRNGKLLLVMEYMNAGSLKDIISISAIPEDVAAYVAYQLMVALSELHSSHNVLFTADGKESNKSQIHRDIKPDNILLSRDGNVKLADFGVATSTDSIGANTFVGTAAYMSPERIKGQRHGPSSDVWSVGIVVAEILMGKFPFPVENGFLELLHFITSTRLHLPEGHSNEAQDYIDKCLELDPEKRPSAFQLLEHSFLLRGKRVGSLALRSFLRRIRKTKVHHVTKKQETELRKSENPSD
eukprot:Tbor_TRINITY_DN5255_c3_g2::TRINITY_DN5255_c3_g2_i1::g.16605::m.16605